jgi:succinyl-diaminopimelate desuccinylase
MTHSDQVPTDSVVALIRQLVRIPSRAGIDSGQPVLASIERWLVERGLAPVLLARAGEPVGLHVRVAGSARRDARPRRRIVLNATLDTADFGDPSQWQDDPVAATVRDGWLYGRGSGDAKAGAAIFAHLLAALVGESDRFADTLELLLDLDEHTGGFAGAKTFFESSAGTGIDGVLIGYPGIERIVVGARGFLRAHALVHGIAAHSGGSRERGLNAVLRAARLALALSEAPLPDATGVGFDRPAQCTVTAISGGLGFAQVPDQCTLSLDLRLTPTFTAAKARAWVDAIVREQDAGLARGLRTELRWLGGWPAYRLATRHPLARALASAARRVLGADLPLAVVGPSNVGNYLATRRIPALCGFGVNARNLHGANERIELASIAPVYSVYSSALDALLDRRPRTRAQIGQPSETES